jgi:hypothetical protein
MFRGIVALFLLISSANASVTVVAAKYSKIEDGIKVELANFGSGFVIDVRNKKSIVVTAAHIFELDNSQTLEAAYVMNKEAKILYKKLVYENGLITEDIAILEVDVEWQVQYTLDDMKPLELVKPVGYIQGVLSTLNGFADSESKEIREVWVVEGQSGGPILALRGNKFVVVGLIVGRKQIGLTIGDKEYIKGLPFCMFIPAELIKRRLSENVK